ALHHGATAGGDPESNAWLAHAPTPHHDEGGGGNQLERPWGSAPEDRLDPDFEYAGRHDDGDHRAEGAALERNNGVPEQQQGKARGQEDDDGHVGTGGGEGGAQGPPDLAQHGDSGQRADRQGQVHPATVTGDEPVADG